MSGQPEFLIWANNRLDYFYVPRFCHLFTACRQVPAPSEQMPNSDTDNFSSNGPAETPRWAIHRRLYDWVLSLAETSYGTWALFWISFAESSFFPIPPDVLLAPLCLGSRRRSLWFAAVTTIGSVLGALLGYAIGYWLIDYAVMIPGITLEKIDGLKTEFAERGQWYVLIAALTPIPFKLLTITAGAAKMSIPIFLVACVIGRATRFFLVAGIIRAIGPKAIPLIDKYFNLLCILFVALLVGGFVVLKYFGGQ
jgi:membrane protein YqaA with SNARE-associated domain